MACIIAWVLAVRTSKGKERQKGYCSSALLLPAPAASYAKGKAQLPAALQQLAWQDSRGNSHIDLQWSELFPP